MVAFHVVLASVMETNSIRQVDIVRHFAAAGAEVTSSAVAQWVQGTTMPRAPASALLIECVSRSAEQREQLMQALAAMAAA